MQDPFIRTLAAAALLIAAFCGTASIASAQEETGWSDVAEISYVLASGNASAATLGFSNTLARSWPTTSLEIKLSGVRAESSTFTRRVTSGGANPTVVTDEDRALTAANYAMNLRMDRKISEDFFWYAATGWRRNRFAGIENRYSAAAGFGNSWLEEEDHRFRTEYAATFTRQEDVSSAPTRSFGGARLSWKYERRLTATSVYRNELQFDQNLNESDDFLGDMTNSLSVTISQRMATKLSLQWVYDHQPALVAAEDPDSLLAPGQEALVPLRPLDTVFTVSLVIDF